MGLQLRHRLWERMGALDLHSPRDPPSAETVIPRLPLGKGSLLDTTRPADLRRAEEMPDSGPATASTA